MSNSPADDELAGSRVVGGYRLIRRLGAGRHAAVYLAVSGEGVPLRTAALKFYRETSRERADAEIGMLARIHHEHCVRLLDVDLTGNVPVPILERLSGGSLRRLLESRPSLAPGEVVTLLAPGEVVTLLAPLAQAVSALRAAGVSHNGLTASKIQVDDTGRPVLLGFGSATDLALDPDGDLVQLAALAVELLGLADASSPELTRLLDWIEGGRRRPSEGFARELESRLFDLAEPLPIKLPGSAGRVAPTREPERERRRRAPSDPARAGALIAQAIERAPRERLRDAVRALQARWKPTRNRRWLVTAGVGIAAFAILSSVVSGGSPSGDARAIRATSTPSAPRDSPAALPDDPVAAVTMLLRARESCIRDLSIVCLSAVNEGASPAQSDDETLILLAQSGKAVPASARLSATTPELVERMGGLAVVRLGSGSAASVLLTKTEDGWRIRTVLRASS